MKNYIPQNLSQMNPETIAAHINAIHIALAKLSDQFVELNPETIIAGDYKFSVKSTAKTMKETINHAEKTDRKLTADEISIIEAYTEAKNSLQVKEKQILKNNLIYLSNGQATLSRTELKKITAKS